MARLLDIGLDRIRNLIMDMATLSEESVNAALESYEKGVMLRPQIFEYSEKLRILQLEVADFATELIARYQPVARDLRFIQSCMDVAYGFQDLADMHMIFQMYWKRLGLFQTATSPMSSKWQIQLKI